MTLQSCVDLFAVLQDKYGSPNFDDGETIDLLNMGLNEYMSRLFPDNQGSVVNFEHDVNVTSNIRPLIYTLTSINMSAGGIVTDAVLNAALVSASAAGATYFRIGSIGLTASGETDTFPVKYVKQNNRWSYDRNVFKKPSITAPRFTLTAGGLQFFPISTTSSLTINVIKKPKVLAEADLASEVELSDYVMYNVISLSLQFAAQSTRDHDLLNTIQNSNTAK